MSNMQTLRDHIFQTMDGLRTGKITVPVANASAALSQVLINSLKVEIDARKAAGDKTLAGFVAVGNQAEPSPAIEAPKKRALGPYIAEEPEHMSPDEEYYDALLPKDAAPSGITTHRARGFE